MTSEDLFSNQPSAIQAMDATIKIAKPATVVRIHVGRDHGRRENGRTGRKGPQDR
jgi:hypothetical protein